MKILTLKKPRGRFRVGQVSLYRHHRAWWLYYPKRGVVRRNRIGADLDSARRVAAEINSQLVSARPTLFSFSPITINDLVRQWLDHHEFGRHTSLATIRRYRAATQHLINFVGSRRGATCAHEIVPDAFVRYLRAIRVSSNGHSNTTKRPLREKGIRFSVRLENLRYHNRQGTQWPRHQIEAIHMLSPITPYLERIRV